MFSLKGKTAIITGSDTGIGKGIAIILGKAGANIVITSQNKEGCKKTAQELKKQEVNAIAIKCDVSQETEIEKLAEETVKQFGKIDIWVNNAGVLLQKPIEEVREKDWNWLQNINEKGVFFGTKKAIKQMKKQGKGGSIINIASIAGLKGYENLSTYCASKGNILAFTRAVALEVAAKGIRVNAICPGLIESNMTKDFLKDEPARNAMLSIIPLKIIGQPEDIGYACLYLCSNEARYVTGISLPVDGGTLLK